MDQHAEGRWGCLDTRRQFGAVGGLGFLRNFAAFFYTALEVAVFGSLANTSNRLATFPQ
ncbi:uncharacterized protein THITE_2114709 [Thermothielavioides terrestris NRRL 8126]|uniref:Uncharacterized protein n=1 Tax=Thermothielavioides terrestris (strain ATCC 38088 / NRRL 8126) TaxID=578455 RepID=G2R1L8_THETT|nr:uncharacterized protein THITE_2114709 [Thermothielavioides terrestris NRRL 8126]AEO66560.1 hypothetical protein THITE_2114709 [Thermothielavioides terrestris NRRL 8126]